MRQGRPLAGGLSGSKRRGARSPPARGLAKRQVTLRLDPDVIDKFREGGPGWQGRINEALQKAVGSKPPSVCAALACSAPSQLRGDAYGQICCRDSRHMIGWQGCMLLADDPSELTF